MIQWQPEILAGKELFQGFLEEMDNLRIEGTVLSLGKLDKLIMQFRVKPDSENNFLFFSIHNYSIIPPI